MAPAVENIVTAFKGFDAQLRCRGYQYEVGKTYEHAGKIEACASGFHACEHPLDVFGYYAPASNRYAEVTLSGEMDGNDSDTKIAAARITINVELSISDLVRRAWDYVWSRATIEGETATGNCGAASATGDSGAASATGDSGAASATGYRGAASAMHATATAHASGRYGRVRGVAGSALHLDRRDDDGAITHVWAGIVGREGITPMTWYSLDESGHPVEVAGSES
ncbi:hypothetical protein CH338_06320 [Rhodoplanes elegans]|uniref:DUF7666 domain-containing protein n=1 Tax=Rhodoplanes elegans TaxID=29408 RepID=A0A327KR73_9BRAD|nr:hypothetical protein CH338_06320 [Rhodoplanes elegans]